DGLLRRAAVARPCQIEQNPRSLRSRDGSDICHACGGRLPMTADVAAQPRHVAVRDLQGETHRPGITGTRRVVVPVGVCRDPVASAGAVFTIERNHAGTVATDAFARGVRDMHCAVGCAGDAVGQRLRGQRCGCHTGHDQEAQVFHWLMISNNACAARGSWDWPNQKIAFLRSSRSVSCRAMSIILSSAWVSCRCEYTKTNCSFMSRSVVRS